MDKARLMELIGEVEDDSKITRDLMDGIVERYSKELDELIDRMQEFIRELREGEIDEYNDDAMELDIMELSNLMYFAERHLAKLGVESDMAKSKKSDKFNDLIQRLNGTVQQKKAKAEQGIMDLQIVEDVYKRAYDQLKRKLEKADGVYSALKKVFSKRMLELEVFRKDIRKQRGEQEDNE